MTLPNHTTLYNVFTNLLRENFHHAGELHGATGNRGPSFCLEKIRPLEVHLTKRANGNGPDLSEPFKTFGSMSDFQNINPNCRRAVMVCYTIGLLGGLGDGSFAPQNSMNRAQAAVVIGRLQDYVQDSGVVEIPSGEEPKAQPQADDTPTVTDGPLFKMLDGENAQQMMNRINASTTYQEGYLTNGKPITEENIKELLAKFEETMPEGSPWYGGTPDESRYYYSSPKLGMGGGCNSFAYAISDALFDEQAPMVKQQNFDQLKVGDVVWVKNTSNGRSHVVVITSLSNPTWGPHYYLACDAGRDIGVGWNAHGLFVSFSKPEIATNTYVYSRYMDPSLPRVNIDPSSYYNETNFPEVRCASCGYLMQKAGSPDFDPNGGNSFLHCSCGKYFCYQCKSAGEVHMESCMG